MNLEKIRERLYVTPPVYPLHTVDAGGRFHIPEWEDYLDAHPGKREQLVLDGEGAPNIETRFSRGGLTHLECFKQGIEYCPRSLLPRGYNWLLARELMGELHANNQTRVLDYGCGAGNFGILFATMGFAVDFLDVEGEITEFVRWRLQRRYLTCRVLNEEYLFKGEQYDLVNLWTVIEHIADYRTVTQRVCDLVAPRGLLLFATSTMESGLDVMPKSGEAWVRHYIGERFTVSGCSTLFRKK